MRLDGVAAKREIARPSLRHDTSRLGSLKKHASRCSRRTSATRLGPCMAFFGLPSVHRCTPGL